MTNQGAPSPGGPAKWQQSYSKRGPSLLKKKPPSENGSLGGVRKSASNTVRSSSGSGERTVRRLRLSKALTIPDGTTVLDACRRMATRRVDAALLTDSSALLCGIITDKDVATRVIAEGMKPEDTPVSKVMTRNPVFVMSDTLAVEALQKMVQGKFRHLPVVENGEVIALLDITKCLYDAIARMEKAAEKGNAIAAAVEGVERQWGNGLSMSSNLVETLREKMFRPSLGSVIQDNSKVATILPSDTVYTAAKKMRDLRVNSAIIATNNKPQGILTSKDILMRVVSQNLPPELTTVDKVMTPNPECATIDTTIVDALHTMHDGKFLHLPVIDRDGFIVACLDVLHLTHVAVAIVGDAGGSADMTNTMLQKFWDSAFALEPPEDDDTHSDISVTKSSADNCGSDHTKSSLSSSFAFKLEDSQGRVHRFHCGTESLAELKSAVLQRVGVDGRYLHQITYEDEEGDCVVLATDNDLAAAVSHAKMLEWKGLRLHLEYGQSHARSKDRNWPSQTKLAKSKAADLEMGIPQHGWGAAYTTAAATGAAIMLGISLVMFLKRSNA